MIRLVAVDDHPAILAALAEAASRAGDIDVVGTAGTLDAGHEMIGSLLPDVVVCDVWLGDSPGGLRIAEQFGGRARPRLVMYTGFEHRSFLRASFEAGAAGYVPKTSSPDEVLDCVRAVAAGRTVFPAATLAALRDAPRRPSEREIQTIRLLSEGSTNDEIAVRLGISIKTVESHLRRLFARYGVMSRTELAMLAVHEGWLGTPA